MRDPDLAHPDAVRADRDEELGRKEGAIRPYPRERHSSEDVCAEELERAVDVPPPAREQQRDEPVIHARHEQAAQWVRSLDPVSDHCIDVRCHGRGEPAEVRDLELLISVGEEDERLRSAHETGAHGTAVSAARPVVDDRDPRIRLRERVRDLPGVVAAPVVDHDDLDAVRILGKCGQRLRHHGRDVQLLVTRREEERETRKPFGHNAITLAFCQ